MDLLPDTRNCGCACAGNAGNVFPVTAGERSRHASRHVPWCMPGSLTSGFIWNRRQKNSALLLHLVYISVINTPWHNQSCHHFADNVFKGAVVIKNNRNVVSKIQFTTYLQCLGNSGDKWRMAVYFLNPCLLVTLRNTEWCIFMQFSGYGHKE